MRDRFMDRAVNIPKVDWIKIPDDAKSRITANERLGESFNELALFYATLKQDVETFREESEDKDQFSQPWRRSMLRLVFTWIEGVIFLLKQVAYRTQGGFLHAEFSRAELAVLRGESYSLEENGEAVTQLRIYPGIAKNLYLAYSAVAKGFGVNAKLVTRKGRGWQKFKETIAVRERVTHPESVDELSISDDELIALIETITWFDKQISALFIKVEETLGPISAHIRAEGKVAQRNILDNALAALQRAGEVDSVIKVVDRLLDAGEQLDPSMVEDLSKAKVKLKELKGFFLDSWDA